MCIAVPGQILATSENRGRVDIRGNTLWVELGIVDAQPGDWVLVHAGCAISCISKEEAQELKELLELVQSNENEL